MPELDDHELLAQFAVSESQSAFATLVERYVNLVYSTALRSTGNSHHAEEITQAVFIILARKAGKLSAQVVLSGWLYQVTRFTAANFLKGESRRHHREQEAYMQSTLNEPDPVAWQQITPLLEEAMGKLGETDRNAVVLRFFENKTAAEVAAKLKLTEAAAHKRVNRALEKLRKIFAKRGVDSTTAILAGTISANSVQAAPVALAKSVTAVAIAKGATASASTLTLIKGALKIMAWTKVKTAIVAGVVVLLATGTTIVTVKKITAHKNNALVFTAEALVSTEFHQTPFDTNRVIKSDGKVLFLYSNGIWQIQFTYQHQDFPGMPIAYEQMATMIDDKQIPGGIREIISSPTTTNETKPKNWKPSAIVQSNRFPSMGQQELFLPWLSLCPNPELPLVSSNRIHFIFQPELFDDPKNEGGFKVSYIEPEKQFLSELVVTNSGTLFLSDGTTMEYPNPAFTNGFIEFSYKVLETTNYQGINFPLNAVLYQYAPLPNGKSPEDLYPAGITKLSIQQIDVGGRNLTLMPVPKLVVGLDKRFGLSNNMTVNYIATNDQYYAMTDTNLERLVGFYRNHIVNRPVRKQ